MINDQYLAIKLNGLLDVLDIVLVYASSRNRKPTGVFRILLSLRQSLEDLSQVFQASRHSREPIQCLLRPFILRVDGERTSHRIECSVGVVGRVLIKAGHFLQQLYLPCGFISAPHLYLVYAYQLPVVAGVSVEWFENLSNLELVIAIAAKSLQRGQCFRAL